MTKKKKIIVAVLSVVLIFAVAGTGVYIWAANNPHCDIAVGKPEGENGDFIIEPFHAGYYNTLGVPPSKKWLAEYIKIGETLRDARQEIRSEYEAPTHLELEITEADDGGTIATYKGTVTKDGVTSDFSKQWKFDFKYIEPQKR